MTLQERLAKHLGATPQIDPTAYVAPTATVIGDVRIGPRSSIWPQAVLRGDINTIDIGEATNIQDTAVIHLSDNFPAKIGNHTTIGHGAIIHACTIGDECLIGMRSTILDGAVIGHQSLIGAHTLVTQGQHIPEGSLVLGVPAKVVRALSPEERADLRRWAEKYIEVARAHAAKEKP